VSLSPNDPTVWSTVLFVRDGELFQPSPQDGQLCSLQPGPYAPAILRFHISFPDTYPRLPPLVTFATDIFHPLITPLTTYMYTTDIQDNGTVSATDDERLPPGGFSLRHGFPEWFGRGKLSTTGSRKSSGGQQQQQTSEQASPKNVPQILEPPSKLSHTNTAGHKPSVYDVLKYIRSAFDSEEVMDAIPIDAAGNPGAWHAWRSHQKKLGKIQDDTPVSDAEADASAAKREQGEGSVDDSSASKSSQTGTRRPGEWNWEGVWEDRVKKGIAMSLSEPVLYGGASTSPHDELASLPLSPIFTWWNANNSCRSGSYL
jgi:hypothetical protein